MYHNIPIHLFLIGGVRTSKYFSLKLIVQGLSQLYNKDLSLDLTQKNLFVTSIGKITINVDGRTIHLVLNIPIQQTLANISNLSNLSSNYLNRFICQYEQLQFIITDEISLLHVGMLNVIDH
jgi:hypothetical protein